MQSPFSFAHTIATRARNALGMGSGVPVQPPPLETFYLLTEDGNRLTDENGNLLLWRLN